MPTKKVSDLEDQRDIRKNCSDPGHKPPRYQVFPNGVYEHTCPRCGNVITFTVNSPVYRDYRSWNAVLYEERGLNEI